MCYFAHMNTYLVETEKSMMRNGLLFEDWTSEGSGKRDGMRMRVDDDWEDEWDLFKAVASGNAAFFKRKVSHFKKWG
jgi:hypothetical protein